MILKKRLISAVFASLVVAAAGIFMSVGAAEAAPYGSITLDTANYIMAPGNAYDIGVTIKGANGNKLRADEVKKLVSSGQIKVRDSRTGSVVDLKQLSNGNFRVTGKREGTCYILYEGGGTHASVRIDVKRGEKQRGTAVRNTSIFTQDIGASSTPTTTSSETSAKSGYPKILEEYSAKLRAAAPRLVREYQQEATQNTQGLQGLASLSNKKVSELAEISNAGVQEMAQWMYRSGSGTYSEYESWAGKLMDVYQEEAAKITNAYLASAT